MLAVSPQYDDAPDHTKYMGDLDVGLKLVAWGVYLLCKWMTTLYRLQQHLH